MPRFIPATLTPIAVLLAGPVLAGPIYETPNGGTFTYYGQLNPAFTSFDDGVGSDGQLVDNASSNSRVGFIITQQMGDSELSFRFETALGFAASSAFSQVSSPENFSWDRTRLRHVDFMYRTASFGTFYFGQGSMASDGIGDRSLAGTGLASAVAIGDIAGSFQLRDTGGALTGIEIGTAFASFDGVRAGRIRYDTPTFSGFTLSLAYGENILSSGNDDRFTDVALGYKGEVGGNTVEAGIGYQERKRPGSADREDVFGSITVRFPSGVSLTASVGDRSTAGNYVYAKVGYEADWLDVGATALSLDYYSGSDMVTPGDSSDSIGIALAQDFDALGLEAYVGYRHYEYSDTSPTVYRDASSFIIGSRWRF